VDLYFYYLIINRGDLLKEDIGELYKNFICIKNMGWTKSLRSGTTGIGYTLETLLHKQEENFCIPDFNSIEIKAIHKYGKNIIHLVNVSPDGDFLFPIKRIVEILGYPDKDFPQYRVFQMSVSTKEYTKVGFYKKIKLLVNYEKKKIELIGINNQGKDLSLNVSWSFELLQERLNSKLQFLSIIKADSKKIDNCEYFHYTQIKFFKMKNFDTFISLIESGKIIITFKIGIFKSGDRLGKTHDRGTDFSIFENDIQYLYKRI